MAAEKSPLFYCKKNAVRLLGQQFFYSDNIFAMRRCLAVLRGSEGSKIL